MNKEMIDWIKDMPKTDLHCHLGGSLRLKTILDFADRYSVKIPAKDEEELGKKIIQKYNPDKSLVGYLKAFDICESVLVAPEAFERAAYEVAEDAFKENVKIFELRFGPVNYEKPGKLELFELVEATLSGLKKANQEFGMHTGLIICGDRTSKEKAMTALELAINYKNKGVVAYDLAGKENGYRPKNLSDVLEKTKKELMPVTIHAGEDDEDASIKEAVGFAHRIGHGVALRQNQSLMDYVDMHGIGIEVCMTSNIDTGAVSHYKVHPVKIFYDNELKVSINTDNRTISGTTVTNELFQLVKHFKMDKRDIYRLTRNGIKSSFMLKAEKRGYLEELDTYMFGGPKEQKF